MNKFVFCLAVMAAVVLLPPGSSYSMHGAVNWATIEYPAHHQEIPFKLAKIVVQLEEGADIKSFKAKLNGKKITDQFDYDDYRNRMTASLGPEDGVIVNQNAGQNILETEIKGDQAYRRKKDKDSVAFTVTGGPAPACAGLVSIGLPDVTIVSTQEVPASDGMPAYCNVAGFIETEIGFEVNLPIEWNGKFYMGGGGGMVGSVTIQGGGGALARGYATAGTDTGHEGTWYWADWALDNHERYVNFGYRAIHLTTLTAKDIIRIFYGTGIQYSYFSGCSTGGRQAMMESQRFPKDFDGIIVGAPAHDYRPDGLAWIQQAMYPDPADLSNPTLPVSKLAVIENTVIDACDGADGLVDGLVDNPPNCDFEPATDFPLCGDGPVDDACLTDTELATLLRIFEESPSGTVPFPYSGCENTQGFFSWAEWMVSCGWCPFVMGTPNMQYVFAQEELRYFVYDDPTYDFRDFDLTNPDHMDDLDYMMQYASAMDPDLRNFRDLGGKMIMYHGWGDPIISAYNTINYYGRVEGFKKNTNKQFKDVREFIRLFLAPGMLHCSDGPGPSAVDYLTALEAWVENGEAPDSLLSSGGIPYRTRPLCPYPQVAVWDGTGDPDVADSFSCQ
jgi:feruloyl esterase